VTLREMREAADAEAWRIKTTQEMLVRVGDRKAPDPQQMEKSEAFFGIVRLIDRIVNDDVILERLHATPRDHEMPDE
jgi:hypothetical protein